MNETHFSERIGSSLCGISDFDSDKGTSNPQIVTCPRCKSILNQKPPPLLGLKTLQYESLCEAAQVCRGCDKVFHRLTYLNENNGNINSPVMFIGEAPGFVRDPNHRLKAFHGNQSGHNFEYLLKRIGLERDQIFVTNALLHTPVSPSQRKYDDTYGFLQIRPPSFNEIRECGKFLRQQLVHTSI